MKNKRTGGVLMPISALPSPYGIGTFGRAAYDFADFLEKAGQRYWQLLPMGPTSYGDSPYQSFSSYAGNPYFIDLELLIEDGLLTRREVEKESWGTNPRYVDYGQLYPSRFKLLELAASRGIVRDREAVTAFEEENHRWLPDYALFMACKRHFGMKAWTEWPEEIRLRSSEAVLESYRSLLKSDVELFIYIQFLFFRQWKELQTYIHSKNIRIIGDLPIYVAMDSADVWSEPQFFQLDEKNVPLAVSGVPPDYFSKTGQLWGNPLYRWDAMEADGFGWWIRRIDGVGKLYDVIRIDHFRGIAAYWSVPYGSENAIGGHWEKGPGMKLISVLNNWFTDKEYIAEDLGVPAPEVTQLLADSGWPGMKVLEFAFSEGNPYLPHNHIENCIVYAATHDNETAEAWYELLTDKERSFMEKYLCRDPKEKISHTLLRLGMGSPARLFIAQMQDILGLGREATMNRPGTTVGNWQWRLLPGEITPGVTEELREMTLLYGRADAVKMPEALQDTEEAAAAESSKDEVPAPSAEQKGAKAAAAAEA